MLIVVFIAAEGSHFMYHSLKRTLESYLCVPIVNWVMTVNSGVKGAKILHMQGVISTVTVRHTRSHRGTHGCRLIANTRKAAGTGSHLQRSSCFLQQHPKKAAEEVAVCGSINNLPTPSHGSCLLFSTCRSGRCHCIPPSDEQSPSSWRTATPMDVPQMCSHALSQPLHSHLDVFSLFRKGQLSYC